MLKRFISLFLILILVFTQMPCTFALESEYTVCGNSVIVLPAKSDVVSKLNYTLCKTDNPSLTADALFSISGDTNGIFMSDDGTLLATSVGSKGTITISAVFNGQTYTKEVRVEKGMYEDFESYQTGTMPVSSGWNEDRSGAIRSDAQGKYLDGSPTTSAIYTFDTDLACEDITFEMDIYVSSSKKALCQIAGAGEDSVSATNYYIDYWFNSSLWLRTKYVEDGSAVGYRNLIQFPSDRWTKMKMQFNLVDNRYTVWVGETKVIDNWKLCDLYDVYTFKSLILKGCIDNINIYSGSLSSASLSADNQSVVIPNGNAAAMLSLTSELTVGSDAYSGVAKWELKSPYDGVSIENNMLKVTSSAPTGNVVLKGSFGSFTCEKTVEICEPTISLNIENNILSVSALADTDYKMHIYKPFGGVDIIDKFITPSVKGDDAANVITSDAHTNDSGKYSLNLSSLDEGIYNIYVEDINTNEISHIKYLNKLNELLSDSSAVENAKFVTLLNQEGVDNADAAHNVYLSLYDKELVLSLINDDLHLFNASAYLSSVLEQEANSDALNLKAKKALEDALFDTSSLDVLSKSPNYTDVINAVKNEGFSNIEDALSLINKYSIIKGIKNSADSAGAKYFISKLGSSKYDNARPMQKDYIVLNIMNKDYASLDAIISAIDALDITSVGYDCEVVGTDVVILPAKKGQMSILKYTLMDSEINSSANAKFSLSKDYPNLILLEDGTLITSPLTNPGKVKIIARYNGASFEKEIELKTGYFNDFQSDKVGELAAGWEDRTSYVKKETNGNKYMDGKTDGQNARLSLEDYTSNNVTVEFDTLLTEENVIADAWSTVFQIGSCTENGAAGKFYFNHIARNLGGVPKIVTSVAKDGNSPDDYIVIKEMTYGDWYNSKFIFNYDVPSYTLYIDDVLKLEDYKLSTKATDYNLTKVIFGTFVDNVNIYSGKCADVISTAHEQKIPLPKSGDVSKAKLSLDLNISGTAFKNIPAAWELSGAYSGVSIIGNELTVEDDAQAGTVILKTNIAGEDIEKTVVLYNPTISLAIDGDSLNITGDASEIYTVKIYAPEHGSDIIDKFMLETTIDDDTASYTTHSVTASADGSASFDLSYLSEGKYNIYVEKIDHSETSHIEYFSGTSDLMADTAALESYKFEELLNSLGVKDSAKAHREYLDLNDKSFAIELCDNNLYNFSASVALSALLEETSSNTATNDFAKKAFAELGIDEKSVDLLMANAVYTDVTNAVKSGTYVSVNDAATSLKTNAILKGIKNVVNKKDTMTFLASVGSSKYNNATSDQKLTIAIALANKNYSSINAVKLAIDGVNILQPSANTPGLSPSPITQTSGGGVGSAPSVSAPSVPQTSGQSYGDVPDDFWAKEDIDILSEKGIISGYNGEFRPFDTLTRAEMAKIICTLAGLSDQSSDFNDVHSTDWFYSYVGAAAKAGLITGYEGSFNPHTNISRQDSAVIIYRLYKDKANTTSDISFTDDGNIADYAKDAVAALANAGIINGYEDGTFKPLNSISRAEIAKLVVRAITLWGGNINE